MKPIYKSLALASMALSVSLSLRGQIYDGESTSESALSSELLDSLRVELVAPNVSGARDLIKSGKCTVDGSDLSIALNAANWIKGATYRIQVLATFGTQTQVIYSLDVTVPYYETLASEPQEYEDEVVVISTLGDGDKSGADATVYAKDGDGNAHITKPLSVGHGLADGGGAVASGYAEGANSQINASSNGAVASGYTNGENSQINADSAGAVASGWAEGANSQINASRAGAVASGCAYGDGSKINASSAGAVASGCAYGDGSKIEASGDGAVASGYTNSESGDVTAGGTGSQAFGVGTQTEIDGQMVLGKCNVLDTDGDYALIVGNGADDEHRSNAFAIDWNGNLVLFNAGTPVELTPAKLATLIA